MILPSSRKPQPELCRTTIAITSLIPPGDRSKSTPISVTTQENKYSSVMERRAIGSFFSNTEWYYWTTSTMNWFWRYPKSFLNPFHLPNGSGRKSSSQRMNSLQSKQQQTTRSIILPSFGMILIEISLQLTSLFLSLPIIEPSFGRRNIRYRQNSSCPCE